MYFHKKTTPQLLGHTGPQNMKVGEKTNFGRLATIFRIYAMDADILFYIFSDVSKWVDSFFSSNN